MNRARTDRYSLLSNESKQERDNLIEAELS